MDLSKTPADTIPAELQRQSKRVDEQISRLSTLLNIITERLDDISIMMTNYSPDLVKQFKILKNSLETYNSKANSIYGDISKSLQAYANNLLNYLDELTDNITAIESSIRDL